MTDVYIPPITAFKMGEGEDSGGYREWCANRDKQAPLQYSLRCDAELLFSILVPVHNPADHWLQECIDSVRSQFYANWELILVDDASEHTTVDILKKNQLLDDRIKIDLQTKQAGISITTNRAATIATSDFLVFLDHDDLLDSYALSAFNQRLIKKPATDILYADEDRFDEHYHRLHPSFKPKFSLEKLLSTNYIHHPIVMRRTIFEEIGGLDNQYDGSQDYDLLLRAIEKTTNIEHVPDVLYHMRLHSGSLSSGPEAKPKAHDRGKAAVQAYLQRQNINAVIKPTIFAGYHSLSYPLKQRPKVSILLLADPDSSIEDSQRDWQQYKEDEILICDNYGKKIPARFNELAHKASGNVLIFADGQLQPERGCIDELLGHSMRKNIGLVSGKLVYNDGKLHSCGLAIGIKACAGRWHYGCNADDVGYGGWMGINHEVSAVPWQLMAVKSELFFNTGLFNTHYFEHGFDIHLALQLSKNHAINHLTIPRAKATFPHPCPGQQHNQWQKHDFKLLWSHWQDVLNQDDPFFHPHFSIHDESIQFISPSELYLKHNGVFTAYDKATIQLLWQCTNTKKLSDQGPPH